MRTPDAPTVSGTPATRRLATLLERRARSIVLWTLLFAVLAAAGASQLKLDQRLRYLLPADFPSVSGIDRVTERLGNQSDVYVTIESPSREANIALGDAVATAMADMDSLRWVLFRRDYEYFEDRALLFLPTADLLDLRTRVIERIQDEVRRKAYGDLASTGTAKEDRAEQQRLDEQKLRERYGIDEDPPEFFEAEEGRLMVVKARPSRESTDLAFSRALQTELEAIVDGLSPTSFHPEMKVRLDGAFVQHTKRVAALRGEVVGGTAAAIIALLAAIAIYFRSGRAVALVLGPLLVSAVGALAFAWLVFGALNLVSAFIFAVLLGLGIDFGIHVLARYRDERGRGLRRPTAWAVTLATTGRSTLAAGLGTAFAFGTLAVADFQGFAQFGAVAAFGIVAALVASLIVMPACVVLTERFKPWPPRAHKPAARRSAWTWPLLPAIAVLVLGVGAAAWSANQAGELGFEYDFGKMGARKAKPSGPAAKNYRDAVGKAVTVAPAIGVTESAEQAWAVHRQLSALKVMTPEEAEALAALPIARAPTLADAFKPDQSKKQPAPEADEDGDGSESGGESGDESDGGSDGGSDDDWDDDDWDDDSPFGEDDYIDPRFTALEEANKNQTFPPAATRKALEFYDPERRSILSDRLVAVTSLFAFIPDDQAVKLEIIADIRTRVDAKRASMSKKGLADLDEWYPYLLVEAPIVPEALPQWVRSQFTDAAGDEGRYVVAWTRGSKANYLNSRKIYDALETIHTEHGDVQFAAEFFVLPEIFEAIQSDAPLVLGLASVAMLLTALFALRSAGGPLAVGFVVATSILWLLGLMVVLGWKLNYFNVIVMPLLIGMAQDDALHIYQRWREEGGERMGMVLRETGGAVFLTTLTTVCGFSGILFANHRGLESMAWVAVTGMVLALVSAVLVLPACLQLATWLRRKNGPGGSRTSD
ncbi:MAG: MMPL family transporter [Myxococcota bacterium]